MSPSLALTLTLALNLTLPLALALTLIRNFALALLTLTLTATATATSSRSRTEPLKPVTLLHSIPTRVTYAPWYIAAAALPLTGVRLGYCNLFGIGAALLFEALLGLPLPASAKELRSGNQAGLTLNPYPLPFTLDPDPNPNPPLDPDPDPDPT